MRRIVRLKKLARKIAKEKGHDLGCFCRTPKLIDDPKNLKGFVRPGWHIAFCVECGAICKISENINYNDAPPYNGVDVWCAPSEGMAVSFALKNNLPKRAKGSMCGAALEIQCTRKLNGIDELG